MTLRIIRKTDANYPPRHSPDCAAFRHDNVADRLFEVGSIISYGSNKDYIFVVSQQVYWTELGVAPPFFLARTEVLGPDLRISAETSLFLPGAIDAQGCLRAGLEPGRSDVTAATYAFTVSAVCNSIQCPVDRCHLAMD